MAATVHRAPAERVQIIPLNATEQMVDFPSSDSYAGFETAWAQGQVMSDPALVSALRAQGLTPGQVLDFGRYPDGHVDIYVPG
jgi:hypothetical protein